MFRKMILPVALGAACTAGLTASPASAQYYSGPSVQFSYGSGYPDGGYYASAYDDRRAAWIARQRWEQHERWEQEEARRRYWQHERWEHRGWQGDDDDGGDDR